MDGVRYRVCALLASMGLAGCVVTVDGLAPPDEAPPSGGSGSETPTTPPATAVGGCATPGAVTTRGALPAVLAETSGLAASRANPGTLYAHNDSGDSARVFAIDDHAALIAEVQLENTTNIDWEDIAVGPCPAGTCVFVGDIGDNDGTRTSHTVYRFAEPAFTPGELAGTISVAVETFSFTYPGGARPNAETLMVHPTSGEIYIVTKTPPGTPATVYKFPTGLTDGSTVTLAQVATLPFPSGGDPDVSGGDIDPSGTTVLLRLDSTHLYELSAVSASALDTAFVAPAADLPIANELNGEAIAWAADGTGYFSVSEGTGAELHYVACTAR